MSDYWRDQRIMAALHARVRGMTSPVRCTSCGHIYDLGKITEYGHYADCTTWRCPGCKIGVSDRPHASGYDHHYVDLDELGQEKGQ